jgi:hypothetical protein
MHSGSGRLVDEVAGCDEPANVVVYQRAVCVSATPAII